MADPRLRELERRWMESGADADAYDREHQRTIGMSPPRREAYARLHAALMHRLANYGDVIFWKDKPSPVPTNKLDVWLNGLRIFPTHESANLARIRDSIREILDIPTRRPGLGSRLPELLANHGATFPFIDSDADGEGYVLENVGGGLLFTPYGWEPTAGDVILVQGVQVDETLNTPETIAQGYVNGKMLRWECTYGHIEISFTLTPTGVEDA